MEWIAPLLVLVVAVLTVGAIFRAYFVNKRLRESARAYAELQGRLIDKFGNAAEVVRYLESEHGQHLLAGAASGHGGMHSRILDGLQVGVISMLGGVGLMAARGVSDPQVGEVMQVLGLIAALVGVGFLVSALLAQVLLKRWGLLGAAPGKPERDEIA